MTDKEKAKAYDEAIERAKKLHNASNVDKNDNRIIEDIFPELKESEDEKIKNAILNHLKKMLGNCQDDVCGVHVEDAIDWLEKQGEWNLSSANERAWLHLVSDVLTWKDGIWQYLDDPRVQELAKRLCSEYAQTLYNPSNSSDTGKNEQKSADKIEPKFKVGNWYQCTKDFFGKGVTFDKNTAYYCAEEGCLQDEYGCHIAIVKDLYDNFKLWTFQDVKDGDVIHLGEVTAIFKKYIGREKCICYCSFCDDGGFEIPIENGEDNVYGCHKAAPATTEQRDALMKAMNDGGYEWDI